MKNPLLLALSLLTVFSMSVSAYSPFTPAEHLQIDRQLNQALSKAEKREKSDFFSRLAQKTLAIRKAFLPVKTKLYGALLTPQDQKFITDRIAMLKRLSPERRETILDEFLKTQQMAEEISRALQIETLSTFEGYAKTILPTPLFWLPIDDVDINSILGGKGTTGLKMDEHNLIRDVAVVLPPDTSLTLMQKIHTWDFTYYQVRNREFDIGRGAKFGYFLDERFIQKQEKKPDEKPQILPSFEQIQEQLLATSGSVYVRWGTRYKGIPELEEFFPSAVKLSPLEKKRKLMQGVDCSGLLYEATNGFTPRNSRQLLNFGEAVPIEWKDVDELLKTIQPLDIIVWDGHIVVVLDQKRTIESRGRGTAPWGIELVALKQRVEEIMKTRKPVDSYRDSPLANGKKFVIRRWFEQEFAKQEKR